jgi:hypothetical protein
MWHTRRGKMNKRKMWCVPIVMGLVGIAAIAQAETVTMQLTGVGNGYVMAGVYTSPYTGAINNGTPIPIICDDFVDDSFLGETWTATHSTVDALGATKFSGQQNYDAAASLAIQLLSQTNQTTIGYYSFAIWDVFSDQAVKNWLGATSTAYMQAHQLAVNAVNADYTGVSFANVDIYSPVANSATGCGGPCPANSPQEFLVVHAPEAGSLPILAVDLVTLLGVIVVFRKRSAHVTK